MEGAPRIGEMLMERGLLTDQEYRRGRRAVLAGLMPADVPSPKENEEENDPAAADDADGGDDPPEPDDGDDADRPAG